jgi:hypothetical protein
MGYVSLLLPGDLAILLPFPAFPWMACLACSFLFFFFFLFLISFLISGRDVSVHVSWSYLALPWAWVLDWGFLLFLGGLICCWDVPCLSTWGGRGSRMVIGLWDWLA